MKRAALFLRKNAIVAAAFLLAALVGVPAVAEPTELCNTALHPPSSLGKWELNLGPDRTATLPLSLPADREVLLQAQEIDVDVDLQVATSTMAPAQARNPVQRRGVLRILLHTDQSGRATVQAHGHIDGGLGHRVTVQAYEVASLTDACGSAMQALVAGDAAYAQAERISDGLGASSAASEAESFASAYREYQHGLADLAPQNSALRAQLSHALATLACKYMELWQDCERWSTQTVQLAKLANDAEGRADAQSLQAVGWMQLAQLPDPGTAGDPVRRDSLTLVRQALSQLRNLTAFYSKRGERLNAAEQINLLGLTLYNSGDYATALLTYERAEPICKAIGARYLLATVLQNIALADWDLGRVSTALKTFQQALGLLDVAHSPGLYAVILNNFGLANRTAGHLDTALALHAQALDLSTRIQFHEGRGRSLFGLGMVYSAVGDRDLAANFLHQALDTFDRASEGRGLVSVQRALADVAALDGHQEDAIRLDRAALDHATDPPARIHLLTQIADSESLVGRNQAAAKDIALAAKIPGTHDLINQAPVQREQGVLDYRSGQLTQARASLLAALATDRTFGLDAAAFDANVLLARVEVAAGHTALGMRDLDAALKLSEVLRVQVSGPELRATSMQPLRRAFDLKVELLARAHTEASATGDMQGADRAARAALVVTERFRARVMRDISLADYTRRDTARVDLLLQQKSRLLSDLAAHEDQLASGRVGSVTDSRVDTIRADTAHLREQLAVADSQLAMLSRAAPGGALRGREDTQEAPPDVAIISYWLGTSNAYAWLKTQHQVRLIDLGPADVLRAYAEADHSTYSSPDVASPEKRLQAGAALSRLALQPVLTQVPASVTRLIIIPDGPLHYVSFAALPTQADAEDSFLINRYEVAYGSSVTSVLKADNPRNPSKGMLLVADAVYGSDDPRLMHIEKNPPLLAAERPQLRSALNVEPLERLPGTAAEAASIAHIAAPLRVDTLDGFHATRDAVLSRPLEQYRYIHFALHATTDARIPQLSSLVLSTYDPAGHRLENRIWAGDLMGRRFNARTVVLSACDTALGRDIGGEGLFSLRYVLLARGAHSVIASLWDVSDRSTASLMETFYKGLLQENLRPEAALTLAMRQMLQQGPRDPLFWAPFTATVASLR